MNKKALLLIIMYMFFISRPIQAEINGVNIENPDIIKEQATIFYKKGNYTESINFLKSLNKTDLDDSSLILLANSYESLGKADIAREYLSQAININPKNPFIYYNLALLYFQNNNINEAILNFEKAVKYKKEFNAAYYNLGCCYYLIKDYKKAESALHKALVFDSANPDIFYNLSIIYKAMNNQKKSEKYFNYYRQFSKNIN